MVEVVTEIVNDCRRVLTGEGRVICARMPFKALLLYNLGYLGLHPAMS